MNGDDETKTAPARSMARHVPEGIRIYPNEWSGAPLAVQPGDVTQFVPMGCCFGGPIIMRPWDTLQSSLAAGGFYSGKAHSFHPLLGAPVTEPSGGILYFDAGSDPEKVISALELMHAPTLMSDYAVFVSEAENPQEQGFIVHCRIMPLSSLAHFFGANADAIEDGRKPQPMTMGDFVRGFIRLHEQRCGTGMCPDLYGKMGGDGDWAKESLCFGFMMENEYHSVCRIWTRAWLVTK
jgi:hypothetical protein